MDGRRTTTTASSSRAALRRAGAGEIVQVQGGHILRSTGRKDRHSKVCTAKGPRDRRVRLSAHTAIQFYDVQDRLGYDRPSKAVDWLITKAKAAIDKLDELPAWKPTIAGAVITTQEQEGPKSSQEAEAAAATATAGGEAVESSRAAALSSRELTDGMYAMNKAGNSVLLPPSMDSGSIVDTIKTFFPTAGTGSATHHGHVDSAVSAVAGTTIPVEGGGAHSLHFQSYQLQDLLTQRGQISQDLKLSLQSFRDPAGGFQSQHQRPQQQSSHHNNHHHHSQQQEETQQHSLFHGVNPMGFESPSSTTGWAENHQPEIGRLQRLVGWNLAGGFGDPGGGSGGGFLFMQPQQPLLQPLFGHGVGGGHGVVYNSNNIDNASNATTSHLFSQRGPLQSNNNTPLVRAWTGENWMANAAAATTAANNGSGRGSGNHQNDTHHHQVHHEAAVSVHPISLSRIGFTSTGAFPGFHIPARIQGSDEEEHDSNVNKLSSASPNSRH